MKTHLNGRSLEFQPAPGDTAVDVIRDTARLTGTKLVCGAGVCGACTVLVDGTPMTSCVLPAHHLDGRHVVTVEGHATPELHPVQRGFAACDALQCGFCTPGFVNEAVAFYDRWRHDHAPGERPSRDEVAAALAGHLCRCGAYLGIFEAVIGACAGDFEPGAAASITRVDAPVKVTGAAVYTVDVRYDELLEARIVRSTVAHARVLSVDTSAARSVPGVEAVIELLEDDRVVRFVGQPLAAIAATTSRAAEQGAAAVHVSYEPLPFVVDPGKAETAPMIVYETDRPRGAPNTAEGPVPPGRFTGNVRRVRGGRVLSRRPSTARRLIAEAAERADLERVSGTWTTADEIHTALEPHAAVAVWHGPESVTLHLSTQAVDLVRLELARHFKLDPQNVNVVAPFIGGAFGAKQGLGVEAIAALRLALEAGRPVRLVYDRLEEMAVGGYRPATKIEIDLVAERTGALAAMRVDAAGHGGVGVNSSVAALAWMVYPKVPKLLADRDVLTNTPPGKPFRAPFAPPLCFALEGSVDDMAHRLGIDPIELHRRWDPHRLRARLYDWASGLEVWRTRGPAGASTGRFRHGVGVAMASWFNLQFSPTVVEVAAGPDGLIVRTATQDMGNGARTVLASSVADVFGIAAHEVNVDIGRSGEHRGPGSSGSRTTSAIHPPAVEAAGEVRTRLLEAAATELGLADVRAVPGGVRHRDGLLSWNEVAAKTAPVSATARRGSNGRLDLLGKLPTGRLGVSMGTGTTSAVYVCAVTVDTRLGVISVDKVWGGFAVGRIVVPAVARSQIYGGVIQGIGFALYEERHLDPTTGTVLSLGLEEFRIPGIGDMPEVELFFHEDGFEHVKGGAVGLAEVATIPVAAAVGNAVFHATGHRYRDLPLRPERILVGIDQ